MLAEKVAKFINRVCSEKGWWHRLSLNTNDDPPEMDNNMPCIDMLFGSPDTCIFMILKAIGFYKMNRDDESFIDMNGIEAFSCKNMFNNTNFDLSKCRLDRKRFCCVRLDHCEEMPTIVRQKCKKAIQALAFLECLGVVGKH